LYKQNTASEQRQESLEHHYGTDGSVAILNRITSQGRIFLRKPFPATKAEMVFFYHGEMRIWSRQILVHLKEQ
jgi:hypothetical protein